MTRPIGVPGPVLAPAHTFRWGILAVTVLGQAALAAPNQGLPPLVPFIQENLGLNRAQVGLIITAVMLGQIVFSLVSGWLTDVLGVRRALTLGALVAGVGLLLLPLSSAYGHVLLLVFFSSIGPGLGGPATSKAILDWFSLRSRATAMGIKQMGVPLGGAVFAATLPALALAADWRTAAAALAGSALASTAVFFAVYRDAAPRAGPPPSLVVGMKVFRTVAANRDLWMTVLLGGVLVGVQFSLLGYLILYLRDTLAVPVLVGGAMLAVLQVSALLGRIATGLVSDRVLQGRRKAVLGAAGGASAVLLALMGVLPAGAPIPAIILLVVLLGGTALAWHPIYHTIMAENARPSEVATALGFGTMITSHGALLGPPLFGVVADAFGYRPAWLALSGLVAVGTAVFLALMRESRPRR